VWSDFENRDVIRDETTGYDVNGIEYYSIYPQRSRIRRTDDLFMATDDAMDISSNAIDQTYALRKDLEAGGDGSMANGRGYAQNGGGNSSQPCSGFWMVACSIVMLGAGVKWSPGGGSVGGPIRAGSSLVRVD
jgi:hypothetical protein